MKLKTGANRCPDPLLLQPLHLSAGNVAVNARQGIRALTKHCKPPHEPTAMPTLGLHRFWAFQPHIVILQIGREQGASDMRADPAWR